MPEKMAAAYEQCRYIRRNDERCTGEVADTEGEMLLCIKHLAAAQRDFDAAVSGKRRSEVHDQTA